MCVDRGLYRKCWCGSFILFISDAFLRFKTVEKWLTPFYFLTIQIVLAAGLNVKCLCTYLLSSYLSQLLCKAMKLMRPLENIVLTQYILRTFPPPSVLYVHYMLMRPQRWDWEDKNMRDHNHDMALWWKSNQSRSQKRCVWGVGSMRGGEGSFMKSFYVNLYACFIEYF